MTTPDLEQAIKVGCDAVWNIAPNAKHDCEWPACKVWTACGLHEVKIRAALAALDPPSDAVVAKAADEILEIVPYGYGMREEEAIEYGAAAIRAYLAAITKGT